MDKFQNRNNNNSDKFMLTVIIVGVILGILILIPIIRSYYLAAVCNHGNMEQFLIEIIILILLSWFWIPNVIYCFWKSSNCKRRPKSSRR